MDFVDINFPDLESLDDKLDLIISLFLLLVKIALAKKDLHGRVNSHLFLSRFTSKLLLEISSKQKNLHSLKVRPSKSLYK